MPRRDHTFWEIPVDPDVLARFPARHPEAGPDERKERLRADAVVQLRTIIATKLTPRQQQIVHAYFFEGRSEADIASDLGITQQVVSKHLFGALRTGHRVGGAIAKLRKLADQLGIDPEKWV
jgi:DNA-directed RNA polymerase specialized sigma24 family protein